MQYYRIPISQTITEQKYTKCWKIVDNLSYVYREGHANQITMRLTIILFLNCTNESSLRVSYYISKEIFKIVILMLK